MKAASTSNSKRKQLLQKSLLVALGIGVLALAVGLLYRAYSLQSLEEYLRSNGVSTTAYMYRVDGIYSSKSTRTTTTGHIRFKAADGKEVYETIRISRGQHDVWTAGQRDFMIKYDPTKPSRALIDEAPGFGAREIGYAWMYVSFMLIPGVLGLVGIWWQKRRRRQAHRN